MNTSFNGAMKENDGQQLKDSQWSCFIDNILNKKSESGDAVIQPLKLSTSDAAKKMFDDSLGLQNLLKRYLLVMEQQRT